MVDLQLESNEEILLQAKRVWRYEEDENQYLKNLYLSNKNLICVYEETKGFFSKAETIVDKISLRDIRVVDGIVQVEKVDDDDYEETLQILYRNGKRELYGLDEDDDEDIDKEYRRWELAISKAVTKYLENCESMAPISDKSANMNELVDSQTPKLEGQPIPKGTVQEQEVVYCSNCGTLNSVAAKYCQDCGALMGTVLQTTNEPEQDITVQFEKEQGEVEADNEQHIRNTYSERKQEFVGKIYKCPNCGEILKSFVSICPACGYEINSISISNTLECFVEQVNKCEELIANSKSQNKKGWSSWGKIKKVCWVLFNIIFICIPLIYYVIWRYLISPAIGLVMIRTRPLLSKEEEKMVSLIENYSVPNDRGSILETLVYVKEKVDFISNEKVDRRSAYWMRLWCSKAEQLKQKADIMFPDDLVVKQSYIEILADEKRVNNIIKVKAITGLGLCCIYIIFVMIRYGAINDIEVISSPLKIPETELSNVMPQLKNGKGRIQTNNSEYFSVEYSGISESQFEDYKDLCREQGFTIDSENNGSLFDAYNSGGYNIRVTYFNSKMNITVTDNMEMRTIIWPSSVITKLIPKPNSDYGNIHSSSDTCLIVYIGNTSVEDYTEYVNACIEKGFDQNISQMDKHYHADNVDGYNIQVEYRGYDTIFIRVDD